MLLKHIFLFLLLSPIQSSETAAAATTATIIYPQNANFLKSTQKRSRNWCKIIFCFTRLKTKYVRNRKRKLFVNISRLESPYVRESAVQNDINDDDAAAPPHTEPTPDIKKKRAKSAYK